MAKTKSPLTRQRVIDRCLQKTSTVRQMMKQCNIELEREGSEIVKSKTTIHKDLDAIMAHFPDAIIVEKKVGRDVFYEYEDKSFSIYNIPLNDDEMAQLAQTVSILSRFEGMPNFDWVDDLIEHFKFSLNIPTTRDIIVAFDENIDLKGRSWFAKLFSAIASQQALEIKYQPFGRELKTYQFHPYMLKQYNNRWFLFGCVDGRTDLTNFPLDRIQEVSPASISYKPNTDIDLKDYFEEFIGVSRKNNDKAHIVQIKVDKESYNYIETKPLHGTQRVISREDDGVVIQIEVIINKELKHLLLSYGAGVTVLSPSELRDDLIEQNKKSLKNYQSVHLD